MSLPRYAEYKDSGVASLGLVPSHWQVKRLRFVAELNPSKSEVASLDRQTEVSFLPMDAIGDDGAIRLDETRTLAQVENGYTYFRDGDVVIAKITPCFENGKGAVISGLLDGVGFGTTELIVVRPKPQAATSEYLGWLFSSATFRKDAEGAMYGAGGQKRVPDSFVRDYLDAVPPLEEQCAIAAFLDRETGKIDALIAEQEKLLTLLAEKRQATISHAVTRGLTNLPGADLNTAFGGGPKGEGKDSPSHPRVPMTSSGISWLGEVPAHWKVVRLKWTTPQITVGIVVEPSKYYVDDGIPALRSLNVSPGKIGRENMVYISEASNELLAKSRVWSGDIVAVRSGQTGVAAVVPPDLDGCNCIDLIIIRKPENGCEQFLCWYLASDAALYQFEGGSDGAIQKHFNIGTAMNLQVAWPDATGQRRIAKFLDEEISKLDRLVDLSNNAIQLLKERRSALIAAAVTGKIDVRQTA